MYLKRISTTALGVFLIILLLASLAVPVASAYAGANQSLPAVLPKIDEVHIFEGELNAKGKLVGEF